LVVGAGIAGLQAIATAKRLGGVVCALDVRPNTKEEVESLGATFVEIANRESGDGSNGYAKEMSTEYKKAQEEKLLEVMGAQDVVITTAQIPNKPAPRIITTQMVERMPPNSVIIDLAGESGGNCELSRFGEEVCFRCRKIIAPNGILNSIAQTASDLFAANLLAFIKTLLKEEGERIFFDTGDPLVQSTLLVQNTLLA
jgi:NAD(P) transhydrogenase subunit alpha